MNSDWMLSAFYGCGLAAMVLMCTAIVLGLTP
jgi:hypothetical protein